jgi:pyridoxamine 5'-phosphate oxidase
MFLNESRKEYTKYEFDRGMAVSNPFDQFGDWFDFAKKNAVFEPNAMHVATIGPDNTPHNRVVLLKSYDVNGFVFFTNYNSQKGQDIAGNPSVCLTFFWPNIERQVRIDGVAKKVDGSVSDAYFKTRPRASQLSAWASDQSQPINSREALEARLTHFQNKYSDAVPRPDHWGGYAVCPHRFEFWQGRENRYHDRICYWLDNHTWQMNRICP